MRTRKPIQTHNVAMVDFGGHPFTGELALKLHQKGCRITYSWCPSNEMSPAGDMGRLRSAGLKIESVALGRPSKPRPFEKHKLWGRLRDELRYGILLARQVRTPTVIACQLPLLSGWILLLATKARGGHYINWLQDFQADLAGLTSSGRTAQILAFLEKHQIRRAHHVVCISNGFVSRVRALGRRGSVAMLPNWAPVERLDVHERDSQWSQSVGLRPNSIRVSYSGTLGSKHRVGDLSRLVKELLPCGLFEFVFTAAGQGYEELRYDEQLAQSDSVHFLGFQDYDQLPQVLGAADILVATLDPAATEACVPSKVLSYLCAGRPIVALMDDRCPSAQLVEEAAAGQVVATAEEAVTAILDLANEPENALIAGKRGREYAEEHFAADQVVERFVAAAHLSLP